MRSSISQLRILPPYKGGIKQTAQDKARNANIALNIDYKANSIIIIIIIYIDRYYFSASDKKAISVP